MYNIKAMIDALQNALDASNSYYVALLVTRLRSYGFTVEIKDKTVLVNTIKN